VSSKGRCGRVRDIWGWEVVFVLDIQTETNLVPSRVKRLRVGFKLFQGVLEVFWRHFVNWACWGPSGSEGPRKRNLTMFLECNT
jgi:hypothetical protein